MRLHHLALGALDVEAMAAFYRDTFELVEVERHVDELGLRSVWLEVGSGTVAGGLVLMIERSRDPRAGERERRARVEGVGRGPFLLAFRVTEVERERFERGLSRAGRALDGRSEYTSYGRDPEGNRIAVSCYPFYESRADSASAGSLASDVLAGEVPSDVTAGTGLSGTGLS